MLLFVYWCWTFDVHLLDWGVKRFSGWRSFSSFCCRLSHEPFHFLTFQPGNLIFASGRRGTYKIHALCTGLLDKLNFNNLFIYFILLKLLPLFKNLFKLNINSQLSKFTNYSLCRLNWSRHSWFSHCWVPDQLNVFVCWNTRKRFLWFY